MLSLLLIEDQTLMRQGLRTLLNLEPGMTVIGEAADGATGVRLALELRPDVVLMDVQMPGLNGVEATAALCAAWPAARVFIQPEIASRTLRELLRPERSPLEPLSEREREVLVLLAQGASNKEIADRLVISEGTVKNHVSNILSKLQAENRTQAAEIARRYGLT